MTGPPSPSSIPADDTLRINRDFSLRLSKSERELEALRQQVYNLATHLEKYNGGIYKPLLHHMLEKKGRLGLLQVVSTVQAAFKPGVDAPYQHTVWAWPDPEGGADCCYYLGDAAPAYAGAYPAGESYPLGWGPGRFAGRPYRRAQVVELLDTDTDTGEEAEQDRAAPADAHEAPCGIEHLDVCYPSDCMHLGWPALVTHLYAAFGFPFHRFCCPALCLKQRRPWPRAVELESTQLEAEEADPSSSGQLCTSGHRVEAQSLSLTIKGPFWMAAPPAKDRPSPYAQAGDLSRNFILIAGWPWFVGSVQQYQLAVKPAMGDETRGQARI